MKEQARQTSCLVSVVSVALTSPVYRRFPMVGAEKKIVKKGFCRAWHGGALSHPRGIDIKRFRKHNFCDQGLLVTACSGTLVSVNKRQWKGNNLGGVVPQRGWILTFQAR